MVVPIRALQVGAQQLEASDFGHRINVRTGDEIEDLADHFNRMADQLQGSYGRLEQKVAERTRDLAQSVSELKALEEIGRAVASSLDIKSVLAAIVTRAVEITHADAGAIYSYDACRDVFELAEAHALDRSFQEAVRATRITLNESILGLPPRSVNRSRFPTFGGAGIFRSETSPFPPGFNSILVVPLRGAGRDLRRLGAAAAHATGDFPGEDGGSDADVRAISRSLAMNNARLFREVDQNGAGAGDCQ